jgi:hypothetical protein
VLLVGSLLFFTVVSERFKQFFALHQVLLRLGRRGPECLQWLARTERS